MSTQPTDTYLARAFEDGRFSWARARNVRRRVVLAEATLLALLVAFTLAAATSDIGWSTAYSVAWSLGMLGFIPLHTVLNLGIRGLFDRSGHSLDEHQTRLRERSYSAMGWPSTALNLAAWAGGVTLVAVTGHVALALCLGFLLWFTAGLVAYWHLAWTLPDENEPSEPRRPR